MSDGNKPERIWLQHDTTNYMDELQELAVKPVDSVLDDFTEYVTRTHCDALVADAYDVAARIAETEARAAQKYPEEAVCESYCNDIASAIRALAKKEACP